MANEGIDLHYSFSNAYTLGGLNLALDVLKMDYHKLTKTISDDKRNYMAQILGTEQERISTSKISGIIELVNKADFYNGVEFNILSSNISILASHAITNTVDVSIWTLGRVTEAMEADFLPIESEVMSPVSSNYAGVLNLVPKGQIEQQYGLDVSSKSASKISASSMSISQQTQTPLGILKSEEFLNSYIVEDGISDTKNMSLNFDSSYSELRLRGCTVSEIVSTISDSQLSGAGSKLTQFSELTAASPSSDGIYRVSFPYGFDGIYSVFVGTTEYSYSATSNTPDMIASELEIALSDDEDISVIVTEGKASGLQADVNGGGEFTLAAWTSVPATITLDEDTSGAPDLPFVAEDTNGDGTAYTIYFPTDSGGGTDLDNCTLQRLIDDINADSNFNGTMALVPGADGENPYDGNILEEFSTITYDSVLEITVSSDRAITSTFSYNATHYDYAKDVTTVSTYSSPKDQTGEFTIEAINEGSSMSVTIDGVEIVLDLSIPTYASVTSPSMAAIALSDLINNGQSNMVATAAGSTVSLATTVSGTSFVVSTSGQSADFSEALPRTTMLKHDTRNYLQVSDKSIEPMQKEASIPFSDRVPLREKDVEGMINSGYMYNAEAIMWPNIAYKNAEDTVTTMRNAGNIIESAMNRLTDGFVNTSKFVSKALPIIDLPFRSSSRSKKDRWFFLEAQARSLTSKRAIEIVMNTISPDDYEENVFQDIEKSFGTILKASLPAGYYKADSIYELVHSQVLGASVTDINVSVNLPELIYEEEGFNVETAVLFDGYTPSETTREIIDGFLLRGFLPEGGSGNLTLEGFNILFSIALSAADELQEERFIELASFKVVTPSDLGELIAQPEAADLVFGASLPDVGPSLPTGLDDVIPVNGTLTLSNLYFRNFKDSVVSAQSRGVMSSIIDNSMSNERLMIRIAGIDMILGDLTIDLNGFVRNEKNPFTDKLEEELINTGYFPSDVGGLTGKIGSGISAKYKTSVINTLIEAVEFKGTNVISVGNAKTILAEIYASMSSLGEVTEREMLFLCSPYDDAINGIDNSNNMASAGMNICMKAFLNWNREGVAFSEWEASFKKFQTDIFSPLDDTVNVLPFSLMKLFLFRIGFLSEKEGDATIDSWSVDIQNMLYLIIPHDEIIENTRRLESYSERSGAYAELIDGKYTVYQEEGPIIDHVEFLDVNRDGLVIDVGAIIGQGTTVNPFSLEIGTWDEVARTITFDGSEFQEVTLTYVIERSKAIGTLNIRYTT